MRDWQPILGLPLWFWLFIAPAMLAAFCLARPALAKRLLSPVWRILDRVYLASGVVAAMFMILILLLIVGQMGARWASITFPGSTNYAGYAMAATSFFAFAHALTRGAHIRVSIFLNINDKTRFWLDAFAMLIAACIATYFARYAIKTNIFSEMLNDRTQGQDYLPNWLMTSLEMIVTWPTQWGELWAKSEPGWAYTPIWVPQLPMSIGTVLLAIAIWDMLTRLLANGHTAIVGETLE